MGIVRNIILGLLILNVTGSAMMVPFIYLDFNLRRAYIADFLCVNKDEPIIVCNGRCYLDNQLKKAQSQQDKEKSIVPNHFNYTFYIEPGKPHTLNVSYTFRSEGQTFYQVKPGISLIADIFHPPQRI